MLPSKNSWHINQKNVPKRNMIFRGNLTIFGVVRNDIPMLSL